MMTFSQLNQTQWSTLSNSDFIAVLNQLPTSITQYTTAELVAEFTNRKWDFSNIISKFSNPPQLFLENKVVVENNVIFEKNVPLPAQVIRFYRERIHPARQFLKQHASLQDKQLVTYEYIQKQMYQTDSLVKLTSPELLADLKPSHVFVYMKVNGQMFPTPAEVEPYLQNMTRVVYNRDEGFRMFGTFEVYDFE